jgi:RNA polymerase sigma-70 factor (ECF subfamily)
MVTSSGLPPVTGSAAFATTQWSVVLSARQTADPAADRAMEALCRTYWYPIYAYIRHRGHDAIQAEDLTQDFFLRLLDKNYLAQVDPKKGRFRSFLLVAINHFLSNHRDYTRAVKRGGRIAFVALDETNAEGRYTREPATHRSPEKLFEQRWAIALLEQVLSKLRVEFSEKGNTALFEELRTYLTGSNAALPYAAQAARLGKTEAAIKMAVLRMRQRYGELLREEIAQTVATAEEVEDEIRHLFTVLGTH